ncbi:MAG TPA: hypothetical protein VE954_06100 [Oligoflexus sp.]|uniref:hypothetical protein n=1 Tax=Oligoflexus sp. TaxID=1971216 RepID=UPI002D710833|nr:hypothetical protein [Oligoflexus sp.]HYX32666.1 hypothetical protein [Oligoflexus sp.]
MKVIALFFGFFSFMTAAHAENITIRFTGAHAKWMFHWMSQVPIVENKDARTRAGYNLRCEERYRKYTCSQVMDTQGTITSYDDVESPIEGSEQREVLIRYVGSYAARLHAAMADEREYPDMKDGVNVLVKYGQGMTCMRPDATSQTFTCEQIFGTEGSMRSSMEFPTTSPIIGSGTHPLSPDSN